MPWTDGTEPELLGHATLNGWDKLSEVDAAKAILGAHFKAQQQIGGPPNSFVRIPEKPDDADGWGKVYERLGAAKDPKEYVFDKVKFKDGSPLDDAAADQIRGLAAKLHLSPAQAVQMAAEMATWADAAEASEGSAAGLKRAAEEVELRQKWGAQYEGLKFNADRGAAVLGISGDVAEALISQVGFAKYYDAMLNVATKMGEASLVGGGPGTANAPMTREGALAKRSELFSNPDWVKRRMAGDKSTFDELAQLNQVIAGKAP